ncbi:MAG: hypothetical protein NC483_01850 [Ruminococcus sp.]|nr:hypothetical protein [Ruminococcus sp.]
MQKEINLKYFFITIIILVAIECFIMCYLVPTINYNNRKKEIEEHCKLAACNETATICYNYGLDENGKTIVTWRGSCKLDK